MAYVEPKYSKSQVNRAGDILVASDDRYTVDEVNWAASVLANWRACHGYPINTFQATLRQRLKSIDSQSIVAQRLKREPSIIFKLMRFENMKLARMQDIGGLRAIVSSVRKVRNLERLYRESAFKHTLTSSKDYILRPKSDGYRGLHLIYRYNNEQAPNYNGLSVELQLRTQIQHAWATAVETMGTFLGQALKSGQGETAWREFFTIASAALAIVEKTDPVPGFENKNPEEVFVCLRESEQKLHVLEKLQGFAIATNQITKVRGKGAYHLVVLDSANRTVSVRPYAIARLEQANLDYATIEQRTKAGDPIEAVLVSAGPIETLRKAYPNYFLDTAEFTKQIQKLIAQVPSRLKQPKATKSR